VHYSIGSFHKNISRVKAQDFQEIFINNSQFFHKQKRKKKSNIHKGLEFKKTFTKTMGLKVKEKKKSLTFLSLKLQKCTMIIFLEFVFGFMDIMHINKQKNKLHF
jgi:hypothetical protein